MPYMIVRHKVADYAKWKPIFDEHAATRADGGSKGGLLLRSADNPNEVIALFEWSDLEQARRFSQSADLREKMQQAGVSDIPDIYFLEKVEDVTR